MVVPDAVALLDGVAWELCVLGRIRRRTWTYRQLPTPRTTCASGNRDDTVETLPCQFQ
jgi:hypothetical protein